MYNNYKQTNTNQSDTFRSDLILSLLCRCWLWNSGETATKLPRHCGPVCTSNGRQWERLWQKTAYVPGHQQCHRRIQQRNSHPEVENWWGEEENGAFHLEMPDGSFHHPWKPLRHAQAWQLRLGSSGSCILYLIVTRKSVLNLKFAYWLKYPDLMKTFPNNESSNPERLKKHNVPDQCQCHGQIMNSNNQSKTYVLQPWHLETMPSWWFLKSVSYHHVSHHDDSFCPWGSGAQSHHQDHEAHNLGRNSNHWRDGIQVIRPPNHQHLLLPKGNESIVIWILAILLAWREQVRIWLGMMVSSVPMGQIQNASAVFWRTASQAVANAIASDLVYIIKRFFCLKVTWFKQVCFVWKKSCNSQGVRKKCL